ncbi:MAG TPA: tetratricopeptide repeat protein [Pyrinomonadaceae bacterium]|jgi:tetratricopeptide (TPR) repeat protein|nr:tetratricopeptide repeat protein [Pyrinomonadaceae bacterium]
MSRLKILVMALALLGLSQLASAQNVDPRTGKTTSSTGKNMGRIRGSVLLPNGAPINQPVKLALQTERTSGTVIYTDYQGQFEFKNVPVGSYQIEVEADWQRFEVTTLRVQVYEDMPSVVTITLKEKPSKDAAVSGARTVSVGELDKNVPKEARKEFERATKAAAEAKPADAIAHLQKAVALYPDFMMAHNDLGAQLLDAGRLDEAAAELRAAVRLDPKAFNPRLNLGIVLLKQRQFTESAQVLEQAISLDAQSPAAHLYAGMAQMMLKDSGRAEKELRLAYESGGREYALALFHLGQLYLNRGNRAGALQYFETYLREAPEAENAEQVKKLIATLR